MSFVNLTESLNFATLAIQWIMIGDFIVPGAKTSYKAIKTVYLRPYRKTIPNETSINNYRFRRFNEL